MKDPGDTHAYGINGIHEIVGDANDRAFLAHAGIGRDLGLLPGSATSSAQAVNNKGQVVGLATSAAGMARAFLWDLGTMRDLGTLPGDASSQALAINVTSDVVDGRETPTFHGHVRSYGTTAPPSI